MKWCKTAKNHYQVQHSSKLQALQLEYSIYAHELSVRTSDLTNQHAFLNGAGTFLWPLLDGEDASLRPAPWQATVRLLLPENWQLACALPAELQTDGSLQVCAADLDQLLDSPILAGTLQVLPFQVVGKAHSLVLDGLAGIPVPKQLLPDVQKVVQEAAAIFNDELPYQDYQFLCMFTDAGRGGLEHSACSALLAPRTTFKPGKNYRDFLALVAHEFFHVWNVKRMRPAEIWEFDYERENYTQLLWLAEGFTAYYENLICLRAGVFNQQNFLDSLTGSILNMHRNPGRMVLSLAQSSFDAWVRLYQPDENTRNSSQNYYNNGSLAALCLDLSIRCSSRGERSLDDAVRSLFAQTFIKGRGYTYEDIRSCINAAAGAPQDELLHNLIHSPFNPDIAAALAPFGMELKGEERQAPYLGASLQRGSTTIATVMTPGPAANSGLIAGDEILGMAGLRVKQSNWNEIFLQVAEPGKPLLVTFSRRGVIQELKIAIGHAPPTKYRILTNEDSNAEQDALRHAWLDEEAKGKA